MNKLPTKSGYKTDRLIDQLGVSYRDQNTRINWLLENTELRFQFNVEPYGAKGDGVTDDTAAINAAIAAAKAGNRRLFGKGTFLISSTIDTTGLEYVDIQVLKKATVFTGTELVKNTNLIGTHPTIRAYIVVDGVDRSVNGFLADGPTEGRNDFWICGSNCGTLCVVNGNTEKCTFHVFARDNNIMASLLYDAGTGYSPDENTFFINGEYCNTAFKQVGSSSATVYFNVEQTGYDANSYAVDISGDTKETTLLGEIRECGGGGVYMNGGATSILNFNGLVLYGVDVHPAYKIVHGRTVAGYTTCEDSAAGGLEIDSLTYGGILNVQMSGLRGGTCVRLGDGSTWVNYLKLTVNCGPINDSSDLLIVDNMSYSNIEIVSGVQSAVYGKVTLNTMTESNLTLPGRIIVQNRTVDGTFTGGAKIDFNGSANSTQIAAFSTPLAGMRIFNTSINRMVEYRDGGWRPNADFANAASHSYASGHVAWTMTAAEAAASFFTVTLADAGADAVFPAAVPGKMLVWYNNSGQSIQVKVTGQAGVATTNGKYAILIMNAVDVVKVYEQP
jgi:hypothetical protein